MTKKQNTKKQSLLDLVQKYRTVENYPKIILELSCKGLLEQYEIELKDSNLAKPVMSDDEFRKQILEG